MIVYKLTFPNGKLYIGQTTKMLSHRITQHIRAVNAGSLLAVHCAWRKYGDPSASILSQHETQASLHAAEIDAIRAFDCISPRGYNLCAGGETAPSKTPAVAAKIAAKAVGRLHSDDTRAKMSAKLADRWQDDEQRAAMIAGAKASWTPEMRAAASDRAKARAAKRKAEGWVMPQSTRDAISASRANLSAETRAKMSASAKARVRTPFTEEHCSKISGHVAASWKNPEIRAKRLAAIAAAKAVKKIERDCS